MVTPTADDDDAAVVQIHLEKLLANTPTSDVREFLGAQYDLGLAWVHFPVGLGGLGVAPQLQTIVNDTLIEADAPLAVAHNVIGHGMVAPTLVAHASDSLAPRYLRPLFTGEEIWCQLFSEPGAGSDLASLATRAVRDGDEWVVNGQKVWTTLGHLARFGLLLARTDPEQPKHKGLTAFVVDMHDERVEVRPLVQMTGHAEFNEVYITDLRIADSRRIGGIGEGWRVALTTLMNERVAIGGRTPAQGSGRIAEAVAAWQTTRDVDRLDELMRLWVDAEVLRLTNVRARQMRALGTPGPEGSIGKVVSGELNKRIGEFVVNCLGADGMLKPSGYPMTRRAGQVPYEEAVEVFLRMRATSIEGGTTEIGKNILAERVLGLPAEPRTDRDEPWSAIRRA